MAMNYFFLNTFADNCVLLNERESFWAGNKNQFISVACQQNFYTYPIQCGLVADR